MSGGSVLNGRLRFAGACLLVLFGAWLGARFYLARHTAGSGVRVPVGEASPPTASDLRGEPDPAQPPPVKIPERLPAFALHDLSGASTPIDTWRGHPLVLNFWATWCAPCRREIPLLERLSREWAGRGVTVVGVAVDHADKVAEFAKELRIGYPLLVGEQDALDVAAALGVASPVFPFTVFTDRRAEVVALYLGELHAAQADLILGEVARLDAGQDSLAAARSRIEAGLKELASAPPG